MVSPDPALIHLAEAVSDGTDVDWSHAEASAGTESERQTIRHLRTLAGLASAARAQADHWGPLQIRGEIGRGVFGVVYRAWDARLEREVALKLLPAPHRGVAAAAIREGRLLAKIRHPNVVTVLGADEADGSIGIWMELINGRTLRDIVSTYGPFGGAEAAIIGRDLCRALAAVHRQGFVHRDVKAQNVMREAGGRTVLMDFGAGQALPEAGDAPSILRGTPAYLAPEVIDGGAPSVQSDIYSLGVLLYFLVSGTFPVSGASFDDIRTQHQSNARKFLRDVCPDMPAGFVSVVDSCIAPDPGARPQTAGAVEALLNASLETESLEALPGTGAARPSKIARWSPGRGVAAALLSAAALAATALGGWMWTSRGAEPIRRDSVAILPFRNLTADTDTAYFSEGITSDLIASLSSLRDLRVIAGSSMSKYTDGRRSPVEIGKELGVATVLEANIRQSGDAVRIVAQLIDASTGEQIWSDRFDGRVTDIIQMKSDVSHKIAIALRGELSQRDEELLRAGSRHDPVAFDFYMKGHRQWLLGTQESLTRSVQYFHDAVNRDPSFALAYTGIADAYYRMGANGMLPRDEAYSRALASAQKAVQLDESLAEAHASLAQARKNKFEWAAAERSFKRAIELKPGYAKARHWYSVFLTQHARFGEALAEIRIAMSLDPMSKEPRLQLASVLSFMRRYDDALAQYEEALKMDADFPLAYRHMAQTLVDKGDFVRAADLYEQARRRMAIGGEDQELKADLGYLFALSGRQQEALAIAQELTTRYNRAGEAVAGSIAAIYTGLGRRSEAIDWLEKAAAVRDPETGYLRVEPRWDGLRAEPRFVRLLEQLGFTN